jgi:hypothetical protein
VTPEENERLEALERRLGDAERRLSRLESLPAQPLERSAPAPPPPVTKPPVTKPPFAAATPDPPPSGNLEATFGLHWLSRIAVVTVVLALAFFFEYAFENHWITESGRVVLGVICGAVALVFGERFWRAGQRTYGQALTAAGIAFLYLSIWAAFGLYHLIPQGAGFVLMVLVTAAAGFLALRYDSVAVALLGLGGGFATPLLLGDSNLPWVLLGYALVLGVGAAFAARARHWRWLEGLALLGTIVLYISQLPAAASGRAEYTFFVLAYYGVFATSRHLGVFIGAQVLASLALADIWEPAEGGLAAAWLLSIAGLVVADLRDWSTAVTASFVGFWLAYADWYAESAARPFATTQLLLTAAYAAFLAWPPWRANKRGQALRFQDLTLMALNAAFYFGAAYGLLQSAHADLAGMFAIALAIVQMAAARLLWPRDARGALLASGVSWVLLVLAAPIQLAGYRVTMAWAAEAAALAWIGARLQQRLAVSASFAVFLLAVLRLAFIETWMYPDPTAYPLVANARFLTFAVAAAAFWAAAWWVRRGGIALADFVCGHAVVLWGLFLEAFGWAARTAAPQNLRSMSSASISVLAGAYAVALVAAGSARRHQLTRILGIGLIGLVIVKLYLYDVWLLAPLYRMVAFAILGILLLVVSYLYRQRAMR